MLSRFNEMQQRLDGGEFTGTVRVFWGEMAVNGRPH